MKQCLHCEPIKANYLHSTERIILSFSRMFYFFFWPIIPLAKRFRRFYLFLSSYITLFFVTFGYLSRILVLKMPIGNSRVHLRTKLFALACAKRGMMVSTFYLFGVFPMQICELQSDSRRMLFETIPSNSALAVGSFIYDDKMEFKKLLYEHQLPFVPGAKFIFFSPALRYANQLLGQNKSIVIKPADGSLSRHTFVNIKSAKQVKAAIKSVFLISLEVLVEEFVEGFDYRATMVGFSQIAVAKRMPSSIEGDGRSTIAALIEKKNNEKYRGPVNSRNHPMHIVEINNSLLKKLAESNCNLATVLKKGERKNLSNKINLASAADIYDVTSTTHPHNRALFERVATLLKVPIVGLDIIAQDLGVSYKKQKLYIVEANPKPYFEMHHFPLIGEHRDVAGALAELYVDSA